MTACLTTSAKKARFCSVTCTAMPASSKWISNGALPNDHDKEACSKTPRNHELSGNRSAAAAAHLPTSCVAAGGEEAEDEDEDESTVGNVTRMLPGWRSWCTKLSSNTILETILPKTSQSFTLKSLPNSEALLPNSSASERPPMSVVMRRSSSWWCTSGTLTTRCRAKFARKRRRFRASRLKSSCSSMYWPKAPTASCKESHRRSVHTRSARAASNRSKATSRATCCRTRGRRNFTATSTPFPSSPL
mmetsp:Transcript_96595/g.243472  ORF Transcript_96595/g.243472 Transcript_96595/m.243472 type:complete len:247 (-) Transcript_96595:736-1476(-)